MKLPNLSGKTPLIMGIILVIIAFAAPSFYFYFQNKKTHNTAPQENSIEGENAAFIEGKVKRLIDVPEDETPILTTVSDAEQLKNQPFFAKVKEGDKLLIYQKAGKAILYDPVADKIIDVGPVSIPSPSATAIPQATVSATAAPKPKTLKVVLYNGTTTVGITNVFEKNYKEKMPDTEVIDKDNAKNKTYDKTLIIDLTTGFKERTEKLSKSIGAEISSLPAGEIKPANADILIIVGKDKSK